MIDPVEFGKAMGVIVRDATAPLLKRIEELEARQPERGERGLQGEPGKDADPIAVPDVVAELLATDGLKMLVDLQVAESLAEYVKAHPLKDGKDGEPGKKGDRGEPGLKGEPGAEGVGVAGAVIDRDGGLILTLSNGETKALGVVVGKDGSNGTDGKDGLSFDTAEGSFDAERGFVVRMASGDRSAEFVLPYMRHGGFWSEGKAANPGESMTHDGALWIAKRATKVKPCLEHSEDWILAARKGRDGKDGRNGIDLTRPVKVDGSHD